MKNKGITGSRLAGLLLTACALGLIATTAIGRAAHCQSSRGDRA